MIHARRMIRHAPFKVPADLSGDEDLPTLGGAAVAIALGGGPIVGVRNSKPFYSWASTFTIVLAI